MVSARKAGNYRIGVLMGGMNIEREVSFNSGRTICDHLDSGTYDIIPIFQTENGELYLLEWRFLHRGKISDFRKRLAQEAKRIRWDELKKLIDFLYIAVHGRYAEDGTLQGMLEVLGIPYLGAKVFGSALGMNKAMHKQILKSRGIRVPHGIVIKKDEAESITADELNTRLAQTNVSFPCFVKPAHEGSSLGITVVHTLDDLKPAIAKAFTIDDYKTQDVLVEEKVEGMEFVCVSLQKIKTSEEQSSSQWFSLPITEVVPEQGSEFFDYEQKYMPGRASKITPARCTQEDGEKIVQTCQQAASILNFSTLARIDGILNKQGEVVIIDPNSLTGMGPSTFLFHQAAEFGMNHTQLINFLIERELVEYGLVEHKSINQTHQNKKDSTMDLFNQKIRIAILFGGDSNEREISLESGRNVCYKLSPQKYDIIPLFVNDAMELFKLSPRLLIRNSTREIAQQVTQEMQVTWSDLPGLCDFVFIGLHGGKGESGAVQGTLELLGLPYNGSGVLTSALCMDKHATNNFLHAQGFDVPRSCFIEKNAWLTKSNEEQKTFVQECARQLNYPLVVKPHDDGCSTLVQKATSDDEIFAAINAIFTSDKSGALIEEFVKGVELTCGVYGNHQATALPPSQAVAQQGILSIQEKFLPGAGENLTPAPLPSSTLHFVRQTLEKAYMALDCKGYVRIDCFYQAAEEGALPNPLTLNKGTKGSEVEWVQTEKRERLVILEFNTLPALTPATCLFHQTAEVGMKPMDFIDMVIELGFENHKKKKSIINLLPPILNTQ
jgi:UDP-N-acetylmuramate--alanine ligase